MSRSLDKASLPPRGKSPGEKEASTSAADARHRDRAPYTKSGGPLDSMGSYWAGQRKEGGYRKIPAHRQAFPYLLSYRAKGVQGKLSTDSEHAGIQVQQGLVLKSAGSVDPVMAPVLHVHGLERVFDLHRDNPCFSAASLAHFYALELFENPAMSSDVHRVAERLSDVLLRPESASFYGDIDFIDMWRGADENMDLGQQADKLAKLNVPYDRDGLYAPRQDGFVAKGASAVEGLESLSKAISCNIFLAMVSPRADGDARLYAQIKRLVETTDSERLHEVLGKFLIANRPDLDDCGEAAAPSVRQQMAASRQAMRDSRIAPEIVHARMAEDLGEKKLERWLRPFSVAQRQAARAGFEAMNRNHLHRLETARSDFIEEVRHAPPDDRRQMLSSRTMTETQAAIRGAQLLFLQEMISDPSPMFFKEGAFTARARVQIETGQAPPLRAEPPDSTRPPMGSAFAHLPHECTELLGAAAIHDYLGRLPQAVDASKVINHLTSLYTDHIGASKQQLRHGNLQVLANGCLALISKNAQVQFELECLSACDALAAGRLPEIAMRPMEARPEHDGEDAQVPAQFLRLLGRHEASKFITLYSAKTNEISGPSVFLAMGHSNGDEPPTSEHAMYSRFFAHDLHRPPPVDEKDLSWL